MDSSFYEVTIEQFARSGREISAYVEKLNSLPSGSLTTKTKNGRTYYYSKYRDGDSIKSEYIGNTETSAKEYVALVEERKRTEETLRKLNIERDAVTHALLYKGWSAKEEYNFSVYYSNRLVADVFARDEDVRLYRYETNPAMQLFYTDNITRYELGEVLTSRCWDEGRENLNLYLDKIGVAEYNPYLICRKTHGIMLSDSFWFKFLGEKFDGTKILRRYNLV